MTKRNPYAATLAQPQYRQRVRHCPTVAELRALAAKADEGVGGIDLGELSPAQMTEWLATVQADGWQEPTRQPDEEL